MANRKRALDEKVKPFQHILEHANLAEVARQTGVAESTLRYDRAKVLAALPQVLENRRPGPKPAVVAVAPAGAANGCCVSCMPS